MKSYYNTVVSTTISRDGKYLVCGNVYGDVIVQKLSTLSLLDEDSVKATSKIAVNISEKCHISTLISTEDFVIAGIGNQLMGWSWNDFINYEIGLPFPKSSWTISVPQLSSDNDSWADVNSLMIGHDINGSSKVLFAGCGDNVVYSFSLEDGRLLRSYKGHKDYIHSIDIKDNVLVSGSEDGCIRLWDCRTSDAVNVLEPHRHKDAERPCLGMWIGDVSLNDDWLVCGGGVRLSLWNLRNTSLPMSILTKTNDDGIHVAKFYNDRILAGGMAPYFSILSYNNELYSEVESSNGIIYSCAVSNPTIAPTTLCIVGNGNFLDITTNFKFREYVIPFY